MKPTNAKRAMRAIPILLLLLLLPEPIGSPAQNVVLVPEAKDVPSQPLLIQKILHDEHCQQWVDSVMNTLSLKEKVGQLFIYTIAPEDNKRNLALLHEVIDTYKVGGLLFSGGTVQGQALLTNEAQQQTDIPLMIAFDGEWGLAMRLKGTPTFPRNMVLGCIQNDSLLYEYGYEMAQQCRMMGVQVNFAPVADVNINPNNPVIGNRSFGEDPMQVARKVVAYASGLESGGVLSVCKHFPGHGDTDVDSHKALPVLPFSRERLDSVELYPFKKAIRSGLGGVMVGHLQVPSLEPVAGLPSSLSHNIVNDLLTEELAFKGLIFTDALEMKGASGNWNVCLQALKAGNDMVLAPHALKKEIAAVLAAVENGDLDEEEIDRKCRKVLTYKYALGLSEKPFVQLSDLEQRLNSPSTYDLIRRLNLAAITVLSNKNDVLPLHTDIEQTTALLEVGGLGETDELAEQLSSYTALERFRLRPNLTADERQILRNRLATYKQIIVAITEQRLASYQTFLDEFVSEKSIVYLFFTPSKTMMSLPHAVENASAVVLGHSHGKDVQRQIADVLFARATANGRLSVGVGNLFHVGDGITITPPETPSYLTSKECKLSEILLAKIDSIALEGIMEDAYPGCQVLIMKDGHVIIDKSWGTYAGVDSPPVDTESIYDLASLSKIAGTLLAIMKLYDEGRFKLTDKVSDYLPFLQQSDKKNITIQELLYHQSGLPSGIALYPETIDKDSYKGNLLSSRKDIHHSLRVGRTTWANPKFQFKEEFVSPVKTENYDWQVCDSMWLNASLMSEVLKEKIVEAPLKTKVYRYSDVGFILLCLLAEQLTDMPMDAYLQREFYEPMGLQHTGYLPLRHFSSEVIVPSSIDPFVRKTALRGFVHDETAAFLGGVSGNAGLFSTARDVARICQMFLNGGELDGQRYLSEATCRLFTTETSKISRRGLGFDRPDTKDISKSPCGQYAPAEVYGHTGFTGTCAWIDPMNKLIYVFLSNRTYPDMNNRNLNLLNIRERIQDAIYEAMELLQED